MKLPGLRLAAALCAVALSLPLSAQQSVAPDWSVLTRPRTNVAAPTTPRITPADLRTRVFLFADDSMQGRMLGTAGNVKGAQYIASEAKKLGLIPMGDNGTYLQLVNVVDRAYDPATRLAVGTTSFTPWSDYVVRDQGPGARSLDGVQAVYGGTWGDTSSLIDPAAVAGKLVVLTANPGAFSPGAPGGVDRATVTRRFATAAGIAIASLDVTPPQLIRIYQQPNRFLKRDATYAAAPTFLYVTTRVASALLRANVDSVRKGAAGATVTSTPRFVESPIEHPAYNVVAAIRGSDPKLRDEYVAIGAHNDHVGWNRRPVAHDSIYVVHHLFRTGGAEDPPPRLTTEQQAEVNAILAEIRRRTDGASARPDSIYNGADDDASGSMSVLEIAQYFAAQKTKPKRSLLFVWHAGEEAGLYGSEWYTDHPTVPRESIVAQLNMDMVGRGSAADVTGITKEGVRYRGNPDHLQLIGSRRLSTELGDLAETVVRTQARPFRFDYALDANGHPLNIYCRSDHYEYARYGIPVIFFTTGGHADYHQVTDEPQYIDYDRLTRVSQYVADLAATIANLDHRVVVDKAKPDPRAECVQ